MLIYYDGELKFEEFHGTLLDVFLYFRERLEDISFISLTEEEVYFYSEDVEEFFEMNNLPYLRQICTLYEEDSISHIFLIVPRVEERIPCMSKIYFTVTFSSGKISFSVGKKRMSVELDKEDLKIHDLDELCQMVKMFFC